MVFEMFLAPQPWPVVAAANELALAHVRPARPGHAAGPGRLDRRPGQPAAGGPARRALALQHQRSVLGVLLARAAGQPFGEVLRTRVFEPLGMRDTGFFTTETDRLATAYRATATGLEVYDAPGGAWSRPPAFEDGSGGWSPRSTTCSPSPGCCCAAGTPVLPAERRAAMCTRPADRGAERAGGRFRPIFGERSWGFGQAVAPSGAFGWDGGLGTSWLVDPRTT